MTSQQTTCLLILSLVAFILVITPQSSFASSLTISGSEGQNIINFRDITIVSDDFTPIITTDRGDDPYSNGETGYLTVIDHNANVDLDTAEIIYVNVGSEEFPLTETGVNTGEFYGPFTSNGDEIIYNPIDPVDVPRAQIDIDLADAGDITISDVVYTSPDAIGCPFGFSPVVHGLSITLSNGAALNQINSVTISYANAVLLAGDPALIKMFYQDDPINSYLMVTEYYDSFGNPDANNFEGKTIKTDPAILSIAQGSGSEYPYLGTLGEGIYVPVLDLGCGGGGGGGISRAGIVVQAVGAIALFSGSIIDGPPTLGLDQNLKRVVDDGFSFNDNPIDVKQYYTPYPLVTTPVGQNNTVKLKIYDERGPDNISHVGLSYGLGKGETFSEGRATIEFDRTFDGVESVNVFDPNDVLGSINVTTAEVNCAASNKNKCLEVTFDHMFREPLEYNMVSTNIWDLQRNGWQNYFNHGIHIVGESMNPPDEYSGIYRGNIYHLTETGKDTAVDEDGNGWTFDRTWNRDYIKPVKADADILNPIKINAIEKLGFSYSYGHGIFGFDRVDHRFADYKSQQQLQAKTMMATLCPTCQEEPFENISNILTHDMPDRESKLQNPEIQNTMKAEEQKAQEFLKQYFEKMYPGKVND